MKKLKNYAFIILSFILISCSSKSSETNVVPQKETSAKSTYILKTKSLTNEEFNKWVVPSFDGYESHEMFKYEIPPIEQFNYPYISGLDDKNLENKINQLIKDSIFNENFVNTSMPMNGLSISNAPFSPYGKAKLIQNNNYINIPLFINWQTEKDSGNSFSITIDLKTGKSVYLKDIINFNENFIKKLLYEKGFIKDLDSSILDYNLSEYLLSQYYIEDNPINDTFKEFNYGKTNQFLILDDGILLTHFLNNTIPIGYGLEIFIPYENLKDYIIVDLWDKNKSN